MIRKKEKIIEEAAAQESEDAVQAFITEHAGELNITQLQLIWATYYGVSPLGITMIQGRGHVNQQGVSEKWKEHLEERGYEFVEFQLRDLTPGTTDEASKPHRVVGYDTYIAVRTPEGELKEVGTKEPLVVNNQLIPTGEPGWAAFSDSPVGRNQKKARPGDSNYSTEKESLAYLKMHAATRARLRGKKALLLMDGKSLPTLAEEMDIETLFGAGDVVPINNTQHAVGGTVYAPEPHIGPPSGAPVPLKKAKELFDGKIPSVKELWAIDKNYCRWIAENVLDQPAGDAMRAFLQTLTIENMDGSEAFKEARKRATDYRPFMDKLLADLEAGGYDNRKEREQLIMELFDKQLLEQCTIAQVRTLANYATKVAGGMDAEAAKAMVEVTNVPDEDSSA
jgi:hypothetical protein